MGSRNLLDELIAMEVALEWEREKKRIMEESLWDAEMALQEKVQERSELMAEKEKMLVVADIDIKGQLIDNFMVFIGAVEKNDLEKTQKFDEKAMMDAVAALIPVEESMVVAEAVARAQAIDGTKTDGGECSNAGGNTGN